MRLSALRCSRIPLQSPRQIRPTTSAPQDPDVFANSLRKTLDAHRTSNRARLIRKVYPRSPPAGLWRPEIPLESRPKYQVPTPPTPTVKEPELKETASRRRRRLRVRDKDTTTRSTRSQPSHTFIQSSDTGSNPKDGNHPWLSHLEPSTSNSNADAATFLSAEILALERYLTANSQEAMWIDQLNAQVVRLLQPVVPYTPQVIGSRQIGLALVHSDLHFLLPFEDLPRAPERLRKPSATRPQIQDAHLRLLRQVEATFKSSPYFGQVQFSGKRRSILEVRHHPTGLLLRFHCSEAPPAIISYLKNYLVQYPTIRPLYMAARALLEARGLFGSSQSGIRPDALAMLLVVFFKMNHGRFSAPFNVGEQFLAFLRFYGTEIDLRSVGLSAEPPGVFGFDKIQESSEQGKSENAQQRGQRSLVNARRTAVTRGNILAGQRLCIQDPTHSMNDLGRSCTRTVDLQNVFSTAHQQLLDACHGSKDALNMESILAVALRANFDQLKVLREQLASGDADFGTREFSAT